LLDSAQRFGDIFVVWQWSRTATKNAFLSKRSTDLNLKGGIMIAYGLLPSTNL